MMCYATEMPEAFPVPLAVFMNTRRERSQVVLEVITVLVLIFLSEVVALHNSHICVSLYSVPCLGNFLADEGSTL